MKKQAVIILGPPGAGKGTQANLLADRIGLEHIETSKVIERFFKKSKEGRVIEVEGKEYPIEEEKRIWREGELCSPPFVVWLLREKVKKMAEEGESIIFSGSPRTLYEAENLMPLLKECFGKIKIFFLEIGVEDSVFRNSHRRICELMRHPMLWTEETKDLKRCPLDGSKLLKRELDKEEVIEKRYKVFEKRTLPIISWLEENGYEVTRIDGRPSVAEVFNSILSCFNG